MKKFLAERMTFKQLLSYSEPKRVTRSLTVRGPPLKIEAFEDEVFHVFNFKSFPSTTGLRHHGYIKFFKPKRVKPLNELECLVDCTCPDYKFRWAWVNKQRGSSVVGDKSMNKAWNRAPVVTNPGSIPGMCKHLIKLREFLDGLLSDKIFGSTGKSDDSSMMSTLLKYANNRWTDTDQHQAVELEREVQKNRLRRNRGQLSPNAPLPPAGGSDVASAEHEDEQYELPTDNTNPQNQLNPSGYSPAPAPEVEQSDDESGDDEEGAAGKVENMAVVSSMKQDTLFEIEELVKDLENERVVATPPKLKSSPGVEDPEVKDGETESHEDSEVALLKDIKDLLKRLVVNGGKIVSKKKPTDYGDRNSRTVVKDYLQTAE